MNLLVIGPGRIGSTFAFHLALAGHDVSVLARGRRLDELQRERAIVASDGWRAPVKPLAQFDPAIAYDLVIVTVMAHQVDALLPALAASAARGVLLMFNTFDKTERWREPIGAERFAFGFPNMTAFFREGRLHSVVNGPGMVTTLTSARWAEVFKAAGMPTELETDMDSFLRSHVAFVVPLMIAAQWTWQRDANLSWAEASRLTGAMLEALDLVRALGHTIKPAFVAFFARFPRVLLTALTWAFCRSKAVKDLGEFGPAEVRALIDTMEAAAPGRVPLLLSIRP